MTTKAQILERLDQHTRCDEVKNKQLELKWLLCDDVRAKRNDTIALYLNALFRCLPTTSLTNASSTIYNDLKTISNESRPLVLFRIISWGTRVSSLLAEDHTSTFNQILRGYRYDDRLCLNMDLLAFSSPYIFFLEIWRRYGVSRNESELFRDLMTRYARVGFRRGHESHIVNALKAFLKEMAVLTDFNLQQRKGKILSENLNLMMTSSSSYIWQHRAPNHLLNYLTSHTPVVRDAEFLAFTLPILEVCFSTSMTTDATPELIKELKYRFAKGINQRRKRVCTGNVPNSKDLSTNPEMLQRLKQLLFVLSATDPVVQESHNVKPDNHFQYLVYLIESSLTMQNNENILQTIATSTSSLCDMTLHCALMIPAMSAYESDRFLREILPGIARIQKSNVCSEDVLIRSLVLLLKQSGTANMRSAIERVLCAYVRQVTWSSSLCLSKSSLAHYVVHVSVASQVLPERALSVLIFDILKRYKAMKDVDEINDEVRIANFVLSSPQKFLPGCVAQAVKNMP